MIPRGFHWVLFGLLGLIAPVTWSVAAANAAGAPYSQSIKPILQKFCFDCHADGTKKGGVAFDEYKDETALLADLKTWELVLNNVQSHLMPPDKKAQPSLEERDRIIHWVEREVFKCDCNHPDPGRVTLHRLNRTEYNNTIRDLLGVKFQPADDFPADDSGYGFDNIGDVLSVPPILLEKYMAAAERIMNAAMSSEMGVSGPTNSFKASALSHEPKVAGAANDEGEFLLFSNGEIYKNYKFEKAGDYLIRIQAYGQPAGTEDPKMELKLNDKLLTSFGVAAVEAAPGTYEFRIKAEAGPGKIVLAYVNDFYDAKAKDPNKRDRNLMLQRLDVVGPLEAQPASDFYQKAFGKRPTPGKEREAAATIVRDFAWRAYRRPVTSQEVERLLSLYDLARKQNETFEGSVRLPLVAVLVSPHFLFRDELQPEPNNPESVHPIDEFALASRLSYFLWSTMPDEELFRLAQIGRLRQNLSGQVRRMLKDPKAQELVENFGGQWLQLRNLQLMAPDKQEFGQFDDELRAAMEEETTRFLSYIVREDRSVLEFLNADYSFANEKLAKYYGIAGVKGDEFQKISLKGTGRVGLLTQASILTLTSNPTRTSPVKRGKWVLENLLGTPPPPPPPDVPPLEQDGKKLTGSLRKRMEDHRKNPVCASCHARMDPIGFGLENFDGVGHWRDKEGGATVDPAGKLVSGEAFKGPEDLVKILTDDKREDFIRCLTEKLLTYSLGRGLEFYDKCAVQEIGKTLRLQDYRFTALVMAIVQSTPFQMRRGEGAHTASASN